MNHSTKKNLYFCFLLLPGFVSSEFLLCHVPFLSAVISVFHFKGFRDVKNYCWHLYPDMHLQQLFMFNSLPFKFFSPVFYTMIYFLVLGILILIHCLVGQSTSSNNSLKMWYMGSIYLDSMSRNAFLLDSQMKNNTGKVFLVYYSWILLLFLDFTSKSC